MNWEGTGAVGSGAWRAVADAARRLASEPLADLVNSGATQCSIVAPGLTLDLGHQRLDPGAREALIALAETADLARARAAMFEGAAINNTEGRAVGHVWLRDPSRLAEEPQASTEQRLRAIAASVHDGSWRGSTGKSITDLVHIGIGGSALGPHLLHEAFATPGPMNWHLVDNIDAEVSRALLPRLNPETTLVVVVSKSFTTNEPRRNADTFRAWMLERGIRPDDLGCHFVAVSTNAAEMETFNIPEANRLAMWDWVGGRYSLWSAVSISLAMQHGSEFLDALRAGAHAMDQHFLTAPANANAPLLFALTALWNSNFLGATTHAVLPYSRRLSLLPAFLQQLETESNGKRVRRDGQPVGTHTSPVLWGGEGTVGQHAYHQLLHQGTRAVSIDFVLSREHDDTAPWDEHNQWLQAHALGQAEALVSGRDTHPESDPVAAHRAIPGDRPSSLVLLDRIDPWCLGALLALYEHKVFSTGVLLGINSFDQWGVELGKVLAGNIREELDGGSVSQQHDRVTWDRVRALQQKDG